MIKTPPRAWQSACLRAWEDNGCRGVARVATGAGKTLLALMAAEKLARRFPGDALRVKIVVPTIFLAAQWRADILRELDIAPENVGLYHGQIKENPDRPFMVYVVNTARNSLARHVLRESQAGHAVFLICDECHHMSSPENMRTFAFFPYVEQDDFAFPRKIAYISRAGISQLSLSIGSNVSAMHTMPPLLSGRVLESTEK